ncbi:D-alanyl-D-alanine carboxypeptidase family protein [Streptomyces sp. CC77]|uniref:D-alanyl-D-alanine carboxypeptidase family protein n=1 Tax=Streptomyces sp. CC77 TaxID=1906739 RepID=UPI0008DD4A7C|nr:serine hydrolase [Streptomyces sp. CC77]OII66800.1 D-alanyl-D-alanine carboxypeptidase [Streptomyces sp. CC77]
MIVSSSARIAAGASALLLLCLLLPLLVLSSAASAAPSADRVAEGDARPGEPMPPRPAARVDPSYLHRPGTQVRLPPGVAEPPELSALSWLVADAATGDVLAAHDAHRRLPPASTLKALFALTVLPRLAQDARHTVREEELTGLGPGSSLVGVKEDVTYEVADLWRGVFLHSGNDAVRVLAGMNGGWQRTAREMEAVARSLGARDTKVVSPDGYDAPGQVSSAYDLAVFGREGLRDPDFARYCALPYATFPAGGWEYGIRSTNRLLTGEDGVRRYPGILGVKNGYTSKAGHTLIAAARRGGRTLVVSVMNPQSGGFRAVYEEARDLLDWGFGPGAKVRPVGSLLPPGPRALPRSAAPSPGASVGASASAGGAGRASNAASAASAGPSTAPSAGPSAGATQGAATAGTRPTAPRPAPEPTAAPGAGGPAPAAQPGAGQGRPPVQAGAAGTPPSPVLPVLLVGSACVAAGALWLSRRRAGAG